VRLVSIIIDKDKLVSVLQQIMPRPHPVEEASYIVYRDGAKYYAKSGSTGMIEYSDTDASNVVQHAVDKLKDVGGVVLIRSGTYAFSKSVRLWSGVHIVGEGHGRIHDLVPIGHMLGRGTHIILPRTVSHAFVVGGGDYCNNGFGDISVERLGVFGGGLIKVGDSNNCIGASPLAIRDIYVNMYTNYPNGANIYAIELWHSQHVIIENVLVDGGAGLKIATSWSRTDKCWNFGDYVVNHISVFTTSQTTEPMIHLYAGGAGDCTKLNFATLIEPHVESGAKSIWLEGDPNIVTDVTIIGAVLVGTPPLVVKGNVANTFIHLHYGGIRLAKNSQGRYSVPFVLNMTSPGIRVFDLDDKGDIKLYEPDGVTWEGSVVGYIVYVRSMLDSLLYQPTPTWIFPGMNIIGTASGMRDLRSTSDPNSNEYGSVNSPIREAGIWLSLPAGVSLNPGVNTFYFYTYQGKPNIPPLPIAIKYTGWDQADLDVQVRPGSYISGRGCWQIVVEIINRSGSTITLSRALQLYVITMIRYRW
jgi:hypothetical protein